MKREERRQMLRFIYTICDLFAGVFAIVSPVIIFHWLLRVAQPPGVDTVVNTLNPVFDPLNALLEFFIKAPALQWDGHSYSTTQGVLACILTIGFFLFNFMSETLKAAEQRLDVNRQASLQQQQFQKLKAETNKKHKQISTQSRVFLQIVYDFFACGSAAACFDSEFTQFGAKIHERLPSGMSLEFESIEKAFQYSLEVSQAILSHYASLRPMDPQPPFQIGIQVQEEDRPSQEGVQRARMVAHFAGSNQLVFSQDAKALLEAQGLQILYQYQSMGMYLVDGFQQELFRLFYEKRNR